MIRKVSAKCLDELQKCPDDLENIQVMKYAVLFYSGAGEIFRVEQEKNTL